MLKDTFVSVIVTAAGSGTRMGKTGKMLLQIHGESVLMRTLRKFADLPWVDERIVVVRPQEEEVVRELLESTDWKHPWRLIHGGAERHDSVFAGLDALDPRCELVMIHDGARPFVRQEDILRVAHCALEQNACALGIPMVDTVKIVREDLSVVATPNRSRLMRVQTPQAFRADVLKQAYREAMAEGISGTDDCGIVEKTGVRVQIVPGSDTNIKITTRADLIIGDGLAREEER